MTKGKTLNNCFNGKTIGWTPTNEVRANLVLGANEASMKIVLTLKYGFIALRRSLQRVDNHTAGES